MLSVDVTATNANAATVAVTGVLDLSTGDLLLDELTELVDRGYVHLTVDGSAISSCDSTGLGALLRARTRAMKLAGSLTIVRPSLGLTRIVGLAGMDRLFGMRTGPDVASGAA